MRGAALVIALIILASLVVLAAAFLTLALTETFIASNETRAAVAFAIAEGGLEHAVVELADVDVDELLEEGGRLFVGEPLGNGTYSVHVTNNVAPEFPRGEVGEDLEAENDSDGVLVVTSLGTFQGARRAVRVVVDREATVFDVAVFARRSLTTRGASSASGTLSTNGNIVLHPETVVVGDVVATGFVNTTKNVTGKRVLGAPERAVFDLSCPETEFGPAPEGPGVSFNPDNGDLVIDTSAEIEWPEGTSYFHDITKHGEGPLRVAEDDRVDVVVGGALTVRGTGFVNENESSARLQLWGCGEDDGDWTLVQDNPSWLTVYAPRHRLSLGGDATLHGSLIVGELDWRGTGRVAYDSGIADDAPFVMWPGTWVELANPLAEVSPRDDES